MMDLDESLRALYFAPLPLVVLDSNRNIKMINRPAEVVSLLCSCFSLSFATAPVSADDN